MSHDPTQGTDRRTFLQAGALAAASAAVVTPALQAQDPAKPAAAEPAKVLPTRKLGKTGVEMTMLEMGSGALRDQSVLDRMLRLSFASGVRTFDTAKAYGTEPGFKRWFTASPEVRKQIVLVTKDELKASESPDAMLTKIDQRLEALGTDYVDFYFVHGLGDRGGPANAAAFAKGKEFKEAAEKLKKSGKVKFIGFSTHSADRADIIKAAAEGGFVDAIMVMYNTPMPWLMKDEPLNKALDAAYKAGIGLISMKQVAGQFPAKADFRDEVAKLPLIKAQRPHAVPGPPARDLDRRAHQRLVRVDQDDRPAPREFVGRPRLHAAEGGRAARDPRRHARRESDHVRRVRRPMRRGRRHQGRAGQPHPLPHLPRAPRHPRRGPPPVRRPARRGEGLVRGRPGGRPPGVPQQARLRRAPARGREAFGLSFRASCRVGRASASPTFLNREAGGAR